MKKVPIFVKAGFAQGRFVRYSAAFISLFVQIIMCIAGCWLAFLPSIQFHLKVSPKKFSV